MDRIDGIHKAGGSARKAKMGRMEECRWQIKKNIFCGILVHNTPYDSQRIDTFVEQMAEIYGRTKKAIRINQEDMPTEVVRSRFLSLDSGHIGLWTTWLTMLWR